MVLASQMTWCDLEVPSTQQQNDGVKEAEVIWLYVFGGNSSAVLVESAGVRC